MGERLGYIRISSSDQNTARQLDGVELDQVITDMRSGKDTQRPELMNLLRFARRGDTVLVHSLDRLARNLNDLRRLVSELTGRGVRVEFVKEGLAFDGSDSAMSVLLLNVMGAFAEFERSLIRERQQEGIEIAKKKGVYTGRKPKLNAAQVVVIRERVGAGEKKAAVARELGISRETLYKHLRG
jgi:DNA invertase Pin-like site-specific DNA recombinase